MKYGRIARDEGPISDEEWINVIDSHSCLIPAPDREGRHPVTKEKVIMPGTGKALCRLKGVVVGNAVIDGGEVLTTGIPRYLQQEIAALLDAVAYEADNS